MRNSLRFILPIVIPCIIQAQPGLSTRENNSNKSFNIGCSGINENKSKDATTVKITFYLEGPFKGDKMNTELNKSQLLPLSQPYNVAPWNYFGSESVSSFTNPNIVDWVLIDLRSAESPGSATSATTFARKAAFLTSDGSVLNPDNRHF